MGSRSHNIRAGLRSQHAADRQTAAETFRHGHDIRSNSVLLIGEEAAASSDAGLDLIHDEQDIVLLTVFCHTLDKFLIERQNAALALDHLHHDGTAGLVCLCGYISQVICLRVGKAFREREEVLVELLLSGCL